MKNSPIQLIYHSMHKRPMPGCLPLFVLMAGAVVVGLICLVRVVLPEPLRPQGVGSMYYQHDELTRFQVRQRSALPLRLPAHADPAAQLPLPTSHLPLKREIEPMPAPAQHIVSQGHDSAVLNAEELLALPPEPQKGGQP